MIASEVSNTRTRIKEKLKRPLQRAGLRRRSYSKTCLFGNKTWKQAVERAKRRKLAKRGRKAKGNVTGSSTGAAGGNEGRKIKKQERKSEKDDTSLKVDITKEHSKDGTVKEAKMKAKTVGKRRHRRKIKSHMEGSSKGVSREKDGNKMKKRKKHSGKDGTILKAETTKEHSKDGSVNEAKTKTLRKRRHGSKIKDGTLAKKRRKEAYNDGGIELLNRRRKRKIAARQDAVQKITRKGKKSRDEMRKKGKQKKIGEDEFAMEKPRIQGHNIDSKGVEETLNLGTSYHATEAGENKNSNKTYGRNETLTLEKRKRKTGKHDTKQETETKQNAILKGRKRRRKGTAEHADYMNDIDQIFSVLSD